MKLLPSLRQKKRYLVFEIISDPDEQSESDAPKQKNKKFTVNEVEKEVSQALFSFIGQLGVAQAAPLFLKEKFNQSKQRFILKINHKYVDQAKAALTLIKKIKNISLIIKSLTTTGTIKKANEVLKK